MSKIIYVRVFIVLLIISVAPGCATFSGSSFKIQKHKEVALDNGLKILLIEDKNLPYFSVQMLVNAGSSKDPISKSGLANMVGSLLNKGTTRRNALQIADDIDQVGADFGVSVGKDFTMISSSSLSHHQDMLIDNFIEMVTQPSFANAEISRMKKQTVAQLQKTVDRPSHLAGVAFNSYLFGSHPYGRRTAGLAKDVKSIKKKNLVRFYRRYFRPNNSVMAIVGNFNPSVVEKLKNGFKNWKPRELEADPFPKVESINGLQVQLIAKEDLQQSQIRIGHFGINRNHKDYLKLRLANTILGGAFHSRLSNEIRVKRGLTYSISSRFRALEDQGPFTISTFSRNEKVGETINETLRVLEAFKDKGVSKKEVEEAKGLMMGQFPRAIETAEKLAYNLLVLRHYKVNDKYLENFIANVDKMNADDVNKAIREHIQPKNLKVLVYSSKAQSLKQLRNIGIVEVKSYRDFL